MAQVHDHIHLLDEISKTVCGRGRADYVRLKPISTVDCPDCKAWIVAKYLQESDD